MSVYKRGNIWWVKVNVSGRVVRRSAKTTSKREAQALERRIRLQLHCGDATTYLDALTMWLETAPKSMLSHARNTHEIYSVTIDKLPAAANRMGDKMLKDGLSPSTVNRRLAVVRRVLNKCFKEWQLIDQPLAQRIRMHKENNSRDVFLSPAQVKELTSAIDNIEVRDFVLVAAYTGLRRGELLTLQPRNWQPPYIVLDSKTKSGKPRSVPLVNELHHVMNNLPFSFGEYDLRKHFEEARKAVEMPHVRLHDMRHTFASWMLADSNVPLGLLRDLMGHSSLAVTSKYAHLKNDSANTVFEALGHSKGTVQNKGKVKNDQ